MRLQGSFVRRLFVCLAAVALAASLVGAQERPGAEAGLKVTVLDQLGAAVPGARVVVRIGESFERTAQTNERGEASVNKLRGGRATIIVEAEGFAPHTLQDFALAAGSNQTEVRLEVAEIKEDVTVAQDEREKNTDPRGAAFTNVLGEDQIAALPDDPEEFEQAVNQLAGPGATIRVNGFRGGKLPPKSQIREIRFRRNPFAAEFHERGFVSVDVFTKPGIEDWHGSFGLGFRDEALSARPAFATRRGPEQTRRFNFTLDGPLWKNHTSLFLSADGSAAYDSKTVTAALPTGRFDELTLRPSRRLNLSARVEHALDKTHALRFEYQRNATRQDNLGVGELLLPERAYTLDQAEHIFRVSESGVWAKKFLNEFRFQTRLQGRDTFAASDAPAVQVEGAFTSGGATTRGGRDEREFELADNFDFSAGQHSMRAGVLYEAGSYRSDESSNANGTFVFAGLEDFRAARPTTFSRRDGLPLVSYSQQQFAWYWQDDFRVNKEFMLSFGVRQELQTNLSDGNNFAPRAGLTWSPFKSGVLTVRAGAGVFYDWFESDTFEQTLRVDGQRQRDFIVRGPGYPNPLVGGGAGLVLPPGRIEVDPELRMPSVTMASVGTEARLFKKFRLNTDYRFERGVHLLRGRNVNAPVPGLGRPDPDAGNVTRIESSATSDTHRLMVHVGPAMLTSKFFWMASYLYTHSMSDTGGPLSLPADNFDLRREWGPAPTDVRHMFSAFVNRQLYKGVTLGLSLSGSTAPPYNITTGFDDNEDAVSNDRPSGVGRNSARGAARFDVGARLGWGFGFGGERAASASAAPQRMTVRIGGEGGGVSGLGGPSNQKYRVEFYAQAFNLLNHTNEIAFNGVQTSPFFGRATAALPGRRVETGLRLNF